jgi:hypothetical protein
MRIDPGALGELLEQRPVEAASDTVVDIFDSGLMAQLGIAQAGMQAPVTSVAGGVGRPPTGWPGAVAAQSTATTKRSRKRKADAAATPHFALSASPKPNSISGTPLRIPYGNKELALTLDARYRRGGWYAHLELIFPHSESAVGCNPGVCPPTALAYSDLTRRPRSNARSPARHKYSFRSCMALILK